MAIPKKQPLSLFHQFESDLNRTYVFSAGSPMRCYAFGNAILELERLQDFRRSCQIRNSFIKHAVPISWSYLSNSTVAQPSQSSYCCPLKTCLHSVFVNALAGARQATTHFKCQRLL